MSKRRIGIIALGLVVLGALALSSCEDTLTPELQEVVRVAALPDRTLTVQAPANATAVPTGQQSVKEGEPVGLSVTPDTGYTFLYWEKVSGEGTVEFDDANSANTSVKLSGGDAVITAYVGNTPRQLTVNASANGSVSPSGEVTVQDGVARNITATPASTAYEFVSWAQTAGTGAAVFGSATSASTTVTVTGGNATIEGSFAIKTYTITITSTTGGSTNSGSIVVNHGQPSSSIVATASSGYVFTGWTVTSGTGVTFSPNASSATMTVSATAGDATIQAHFTPTYTLAFSSQTGGSTSPSTSRTVTSGVAYSINANAGLTYMFNGWSKKSGSGTVVFGDPSSASTTVTVTGGNVQIEAAFRKEVVTITARGSYQYSINSTTAPDTANGVYLSGGYLYVIGPSWSLDVMRRWNVSNPNSVTSGGNDYYYLSGTPNAITGNGTYMFVGTSSTLYRITTSTFGPSPTKSTVSTYVRDLALDPYTSGGLWGVGSGVVTGYSTSDLAYSGDQITNTSPWSPLYIAPLWGGTAIVMGDNGANELAGFSGIHALGDQTTTPDSEIALHNGSDQDPGWAGKPVLDVDGEYLIVPVEDENTIDQVKIYDITDLTGVSFVGSATLGKKPNGLAIDTSGYNDAYVFAVAGNADTATIYAIDIADKSNPSLVTTQTVSGYGSATAIAADANYLYVTLEDKASGGTGQVTVMVLQVGKQ